MMKRPLLAVSVPSNGRFLVHALNVWGAWIYLC